jgi:hypothetical protein
MLILFHYYNLSFCKYYSVLFDLDVENVCKDIALTFMRQFCIIIMLLCLIMTLFSLL